MLKAAIALQLATGKYAQAGVVTVLLLTNIGLGYFQEGRAQAKLGALKSRLALVAAMAPGRRFPWRRVCQATW